MVFRVGATIFYHILVCVGGRGTTTDKNTGALPTFRELGILICPSFFCDIYICAFARFKFLLFQSRKRGHF